MKNNNNANPKQYRWSALGACCCYTLIFREDRNYTTDEIALSNKTRTPKNKFTFTKFKDILSKDVFSVDDSVLPILVRRKGQKKRGKPWKVEINF